MTSEAELVRAIKTRFGWNFSRKNEKIILEKKNILYSKMACQIGFLDYTVCSPMLQLRNRFDIHTYNYLLRYLIVCHHSLKALEKTETILVYDRAKISPKPVNFFT